MKTIEILRLMDKSIDICSNIEIGDMDYEKNDYF